jgi:hypothetical protein
MIFLNRAVQAALVESECGGHGSVVIKPISFDDVLSIFLDEIWDIGDDLPVTHKTIKVDIIHSMYGFHRLAPDYQE